MDILVRQHIEKGKRNKTFIASVTNEKNKTESYMYSLFYDKFSNDAYFSGIIAKFDIKGNQLNFIPTTRGS